MNEEVVILHREAMKLASEAYVLRLQGEIERANRLTAEAYIRESRAASLVAHEIEFEPTRSVLHRSAASLALECSAIREAERLIAVALSGNPPEEIANELRDLLEQVYFQRHLTLRNIELTENEFQLSLTGDSVGFGFSEGNEISERIGFLGKLIHRTAERQRNKPFRRGGPLSKEIKKEVEVYVSVPRAASFAITFRLGTQLALAGLGLSEQVISDLFENLKLFNRLEFELLKESIADNDYFQNFIGLARSIAPDGHKIKTVGFTTLRDNHEERLIMSTPKSEAMKLLTQEHLGEASESKAGEHIEIQGRLMFADSLKKNGLIRVLGNDNITYKVRVPIAIMSDIVRPLYEEEVLITGIQGKRGVITLINIDPIR